MILYRRYNNFYFQDLDNENGGNLHFQIISKNTLNATWSAFRSDNLVNYLVNKLDQFWLTLERISDLWYIQSIVDVYHKRKDFVNGCFGPT